MMKPTSMQTGDKESLPKAEFCSRSTYDTNENHLDDLDYLNDLSDDSVSGASSDETPEIILGAKNVSLES